MKISTDTVINAIRFVTNAGDLPTSSARHVKMEPIIMKDPALISVHSSPMKICIMNAFPAHLDVFIVMLHLALAVKLL